MQHQLVRMSRRHTGVTLGPIVGHRVAEDASVAVEGGSRDRTWGGVKSWKKITRTHQ